MSIKYSPATSSSKPQQTAISPANTAPVRKEKKTWTSACSSESWTSATNTGHGVFHFTSSANLSSIPTFWTQSGILKSSIKNTRFFLQRMERYLTNSLTTSWAWEWIELSGPGGGITLRLTPSKSLEKLVWFDSSLKKLRKKSLKSGRRSRGSK